MTGPGTGVLGGVVYKLPNISTTEEEVASTLTQRTSGGSGDATR